MSLENKLKNVRANRSSNLFNYAFIGLYSLATLIGCSPSGGGSPASSPSPPPVPGNNNPSINSSPKTSANEGDNFFDDVDATDPDGDTLNYSLSQKPNGMTINNNDGSISWTDAKEGSFPITVNVSDGRGGSATQNYTLNVSNALDNISGRVNDILNGNSVQGVDLVLGHRNGGNFVADFTNRTNSNGEYLFLRIPTGVGRLVKLINNPNYLEYLAGTLTSNGDLTGVDFNLRPNDNNFNNFFDEVARNQVDGGQTQRWLTQPTTFYVNKSPALGSGRTPSQNQIDSIVDIIQNKLPGFSNGFISSPVVTVGTNPPAYGTSGVIRFEWDDRSLSLLGNHGEYLNGNEIIGAVARTRTDLSPSSLERFTQLQELSQTLGARNDSSIITPSVFNNNQSGGISDYQSADSNLGKILYLRPVGNKSINSTPDSNPDNYQIR